MAKPAERGRTPEKIVFSPYEPGETEVEKTLVSLLGRENLMGYKSRVELPGNTKAEILLLGRGMHVTLDMGGVAQPAWYIDLNSERHPPELPAGRRNMDSIEILRERIRRSHLLLQIPQDSPDAALHRQRFNAYLQLVRKHFPRG